MKSGLLLCTVLLVGIVLGFAGSNAVRERGRGRGPEGFARGPRRGGLAAHLEEAIQPHDSAQARRIREILERRADRNRVLIGSINDSLRASIEELKRELSPLLDQEQQRRLEDATSHMPPVGGGAGPRGGGGPPERDGPPPGESPPPGGPRIR